MDRPKRRYKNRLHVHGPIICSYLLVIVCVIVKPFSPFSQPTLEAALAIARFCCRRKRA